MTATLKKMRSLNIIGRRWFERTNGNTYHTAQIIIDGKTVHKTGVRYGYGSQYNQSALEWLQENGYIGIPGPVSLWRWCDENGIEYEDMVMDFPRKRDL